MKSDRLNSKLRTIFKELLSDGFRKTDITNITFGMNRLDQTTQFVENNRDLGLKPLNPIFDGLGFELHLVPILKDDYTSKEIVDNITTESLYALRMLMLDYLDNKRNKKNNLDTFILKLINNP